MLNFDKQADTPLQTTNQCLFETRTHAHQVEQAGSGIEMDNCANLYVDSIQTQLKLPQAYSPERLILDHLQKLIEESRNNLEELFQ